MEVPEIEALSIEDVYADGVLAPDAEDAVLDASLLPRGPAVLFDLAAGLGVGATSTVLDVGCRDGRHLVQLHERFGCRGVGVEPVAANLARAADGLADAHVTLVRARAEALPFAPASFDLVWVRDVLVHVEPLARVATELARVLRPTGAVLVFQMFATPWLEPGEAERLFRPLAVVPASADRAAFERAVHDGGLRIERREELSSEWREHLEESGDGRTSRQLLRAARLLRQPERYRSALGPGGYAVELADCLWGVYQMIGKLSPAVYVLRRADASPAGDP